MLTTIVSIIYTFLYFGSSFLLVFLCGGVKTSTHGLLYALGISALFALPLYIHYWFVVLNNKDLLSRIIQGIENAVLVISVVIVLVLGILGFCYGIGVLMAYYLWECKPWIEAATVGAFGVFWVPFLFGILYVETCGTIYALQHVSVVDVESPKEDYATFKA